MKKLLLADDSTTIQKVVTLILATEGFEIKTAKTGDEALSIAKEYLPDIILADTELPQTNGYQLCEKVRGENATAQIPLLLLTSTFKPVKESLSNNVGANGYVTKPFEAEELTERINSALQEKAPAGAGKRIEEPVAGKQKEGGQEPASRVEAKPEIRVERSEASIKPVTREEAVPTGERIKEITEREIQSAITRSVEMNLKDLFSSSEFRKSLTDQFNALLEPAVTAVIKETVSSLLQERIREMVEGIAPTLREQTEKVIWESVPEIAEAVINREVELIKRSY